MRRKLVGLIAAGALGSAVVGVACSWVALRAPMYWPVRVLGLESAAELRVRLAIAAARIVGRRAVVLIGDSRFGQLGPDGVGNDQELVVSAGIAGATAREWSALLQARPIAQQPTTFVVWIGVNDLVNERSSAAEVVPWLQAISDRLTTGTQHRVLLLEQIPVHLPAGTEAARVTAAIEEINRALGAIALQSPRIQLVQLWTRFGGGANAASDECGACYADALHLSDHGDRVLRELIADALHGKP